MNFKTKKLKFSYPFTERFAAFIANCFNFFSHCILSFICVLIRQKSMKRKDLLLLKLNRIAICTWVGITGTKAMSLKFARIAKKKEKKNKTKHERKTRLCCD